MRIRTRLQNLCIRTLTQSMDVHTMLHLVRRIFGTYDLNERTGFPRSVPIPNREAARQIIVDCIEHDRFLDFLAILIEVDAKGMSGRRYRLPRLRDILEEVSEVGYRYDSDQRTFVEDVQTLTTRNWGILREGEEYLLTFLRIDIVGNSELVRTHDTDVIEQTYADLREIVQTVIELRNGRIWDWEGDGGVGAFFGDDASEKSTLCGMEIIHEIHLYNLLRCVLERPLQVRIAVHNGTCTYHHSFDKMKNEVVKKLVELESRYTLPNTVTVSKTAHASLAANVSAHLTPFDRDPNGVHFRYALEIAQA